MVDTERDVANKWRWEWLETSINAEVDWRPYHCSCQRLDLCNIRKIDVAGTALFQITERTKTKFEIKEASGDAINSGTYTAVARII